MRLSVLAAVLGAVVLAAYRPVAPDEAAGSAVRADTTEWVNLQVLPDSISHDALIGIMRGFTDALGVRCGFCHVREGDDWDFAFDENGHKDVARGMMRMTGQIKREILPAIEGLGDPEVTCYTCHRGAPHPAALPDADPAPDGAGHPHPPGHEHP